MLSTLLAGKKTYIAAVAMAGLAIAHWFHYPIPVETWPLLTALGLGGLRSAIDT
jgi:hypothetical protein